MFVVPRLVPRDPNSLETDFEFRGFSELAGSRKHRWPAFVTSGVLHLTVLVLLPIVSDYFATADHDIRFARTRLVAPVELRVPELLYFASPGPKAPPPKQVKLQPAKPKPAPAPKPPSPAPEKPKAESAARPRRQLELPPVVRRQSPQTLLQPEFPANMPVLSEVRLPEVFFWAPLPNQPAARIRRPFIEPGRAERIAQVPRVDAPPVLARPNFESQPSAIPQSRSATSSAKPLLPPATSMPVRLPDAPAKPLGEGYAAVDTQMGDPTAILAINTRPNPLREQLIVPPGNLLGDNAENVLAEGRGAGLSGGTGSGTSAGAGAGTGSETGSGQPGPGGTGSGMGIGSGPGAENVLALPKPPLRIVHPTNAVFDVVVVQSSPIEGLEESRGALSGRPVYSVFLNVGGTRDWILQYCIPGEDTQSMVGENGVVRLGKPSAVTPPYPQVTFLPGIKTGPGSYMMWHGFLNTKGRFENLEVLKSTDAAEAKTVLPILSQWEFRPAVRDGMPARVEILLAIPRKPR